MKAEIHGDLGVKALMQLIAERTHCGWQHGMVGMVAESVHLPDTARKLDMRIEKVAVGEQ